MSPELDKRIPGAPHPAVLSRHFPAAVEHREAHSSGRGRAHRQQLLRSDAGSTGIVCFGLCRTYPVACAPVRISPDGQLRPLAARAHRDRGRELAAAIRPMGIGQGRQPPVDLDVANVGRFCRAVPDAGMGHLDRRWLAPVAKRAVGQTRNEPLVMGDAVHMPIPYPPSDTTGAMLWLL